MSDDDGRGVDDGQGASDGDGGSGGDGGGGSGGDGGGGSGGDGDGGTWRALVATLAGARSTAVATAKHNRLVSWLLFRGDRWLVTFALQAGVFALFLALAYLRPVDMERLLSDTTTIESLFVALLSGAILIVSIVSSISSIVLSQEITDIETERERIDASIEFRRRTEQMADVEGSPATPAAFLQTILYSIHRETNDLRAAVRSDDPEFRERVDSFTGDVLAEARAAAETLDGAKFGTFEVLSAGLYYDYSWQLNTAHRLRNRYADSLTEAEDEALSGLIETLRFFATGREYFQSLYYKREVARLSSMLLYVSLPVIVFVSYFVLAFDSTAVPNVSVGPLSTLSVFVLFAYTVSLAPYLVLTAFVLRVGAITTRTLAAGPFTIRRGDHDDVVELDMETDPDEWGDTVDLADDPGPPDRAADPGADDPGPADPGNAEADGAPVRGGTDRSVDRDSLDRDADVDADPDGNGGRPDRDADRV